jgi:predicted GNAT superfamily acetyltransferase
MRGVNANFNLRKLGVTWNQYIPNCYGMMTGINAGAPSDRAYAVWDLRSERVYPRIYGVIPEPDLSSAVDVNQVEQGRPVDIGFGLEAAKLLVQIPEDWGQILQADTELARAWRMHSREVFGHYFSQGYRVSDFVRHPNRYVLEREV